MYVQTWLDQSVRTISFSIRPWSCPPTAQVHRHDRLAQALPILMICSYEGRSGFSWGVSTYHRDQGLGSAVLGCKKYTDGKIVYTCDCKVKSQNHNDHISPKNTCMMGCHVSTSTAQPFLATVRCGAMVCCKRT